MPLDITFTNDWPEAEYRPQQVPDYRGNPYIEALPVILDADQTYEAMQNLVVPTEEELAQPAYLRMHMVSGLEKFFLPLDRHIELSQRIDVLLRRGLVARNPLNPSYLRDMEQSVELVTRYGDNLERLTTSRRNRLGSGSGLTLVGTTGVGKSTAVEAILKKYQQVIPHRRLNGALSEVNQVVYLKLSCSPEGSVKSLCIDFLYAFDELLNENYAEKYLRSNPTTDKLRAIMARLSFLHGLGLLVIDEVQNLSEAKSGGAQKMMNFFRLLSDVMKVPVLTIGTRAALNIFGGDPQNSRRHSGMPPFTRMKNDEEFKFFCETLVMGSYLRTPVDLTEELLSELYDLSQGLPDILVKLFILAQYRALQAGIEELTIELLRSVYQDCFKLMHSCLEDMRHGIEPDDKLLSAALKATTLDDMTVDACDIPLSTAPERSKRRAVAPKVDAPVMAKPRPKLKRDKAKECELVALVNDGIAEKVPPHQALLDGGHIWQIGQELMTAAAH